MIAGPISDRGVVVGFGHNKSTHTHPLLKPPPSLNQSIDTIDRSAALCCALCIVVVNGMRPLICMRV